MALQEKYQALIDLANQIGISGLKVTEDDGFIIIEGTAPSAEAKQQLWDEYNRIDPEYRSGDLVLNIDAPVGSTADSGTTYTVQSGDSLSRIGQKYGVSWKEIFIANRDKLDDPYKIFPGQELTIPSDEEEKTVDIVSIPVRDQSTSTKAKENVVNTDSTHRKKTLGKREKDRKITIDSTNVEYQTAPEENLGSESSDKQISVWIAERETERNKPLVARETYTLIFKVGEEVSSTLIDSPDRTIPSSDIPDEGLLTEWLVTAKNIRFEALTNEVSVASPDQNNGIVWSAKFDLLIPKIEEAKVKKLQITPLDAKSPELQILIFAKNQLYRQFLIELNVKPATRRPTLGAKPSPAAKISTEVTHANAGQIAHRTAHEWLTPPGTLNIAVLRGDAGAFVSGEVRTGLVNTLTRWSVNSANVAPMVQAVRQNAQDFCDAWDEYFNDIEPDDLLQRLSAATSNPDTFVFLDNADDEHNKKWIEDVAPSKELRAFAHYGYRLYNTIFPQNSDLRRWLDELMIGWRINISWSEISGTSYIPNIPWSLMYTEPPPAEGKPINPFGFFAMRFRLNYMAYETRIPKSKSFGDASQAFRANLLYGSKMTNDPVRDEAAWQQKQLSSWSNQVFVPNAASGSNPKDELVNFLDAPSPAPMRFLYFYCHCEVDNGIPILRFGNTLQANDLLDLIGLGLNKLDDQPLVFVNACKSATGSPYAANQLINTFFERDCRAFIGTEIDMPVELASRFAFVFSNFFFRKITPAPVSAGEALYQTRLFLWHQYQNIGGIFYSYINEYDLFMASEAELQSFAR